MTKHTHRTRLLHSTRAALLSGLLLSAVDSRAQQLPSSTDTASQPAQIRIENVVHAVGLDDKPGGTGDLAFDEKTMTLHVHDHSTAVPLRSILAFSVAHEDKPLISGTKGKLAEMAPYGVGFAVSMTRPSADILTLFYRDSSRAIHGCVLVLPKDSGERVASALAGVKLSPSGYPKTGDLMPSEPLHKPEIQMAAASIPSRPSVEVALPSERIDGLPSAFPAAVYENLVEQLKQSGLFAHVGRAGDIRRTPDALVLHVDIESWKKGSARGRLVPFTGATEIKSRVTLEDASGRAVFRSEVDGAKRMKGESLDAANSLAKHVRKELEKTRYLQSN
ncbi:MAG TPA: DUF4410 domain-containing protein [Granulicella sp.]